VAARTLAIGIGVNATVFTVTNAVLFKGFPLVAGNDRLAYISDANSNCCVSYSDFASAHRRQDRRRYVALATARPFRILVAGTAGAA